MTNQDMGLLLRTFAPTRTMQSNLPEGEVVLLDENTDELIGLNGTASEIWQLLSEGATPEEVARRLEAKYDVEPDRLRADLADLVETLMARGMLKYSA